LNIDISAAPSVPDRVAKLSMRVRSLTNLAITVTAQPCSQLTCGADIEQAVKRIIH
jgi:hypothetical protein